MIMYDVDATIVRSWEFSNCIMCLIFHQLRSHGMEKMQENRIILPKIPMGIELVDENVSWWIKILLFLLLLLLSSSRKLSSKIFYFAQDIIFSGFAFILMRKNELLCSNMVRYTDLFSKKFKSNFDLDVRKSIIIFVLVDEMQILKLFSGICENTFFEEENVI